jgi:hypothetical protein
MKAGDKAELWMQHSARLHRLQSGGGAWVAEEWRTKNVDEQAVPCQDDAIACTSLQLSGFSRWKAQSPAKVRERSMDSPLPKNVVAMKKRLGELSEITIREAK